MKFLHCITWALVAMEQSMAAPTADFVTESALATLPSGYAEDHSINEAHLALSNLEKRWECRRLNLVITTIGTSKHTAGFIAAGTVFALTICRIGIWENCNEVVAAIQAGLNLIYYAAGVYAGNGAVPEILPKKRGVYTIDDALREWTETLSNSRIQYDTISALPLNETDAALVRRDGEPHLLSRVQIGGIALGGGRKQDIVVNQFEDNQAVLHIPSRPIGTPGSIEKRDTHGFKISFTQRKKSLLNDRHKNEMAAWAAATWGVYANQGWMSDFIGFASTDHASNFYYRIIPELYGFGLNYESVDICGGMADML